MKSPFTALLAASLLACAAPAGAQNTFTMDGYQNCQRASNGRPYCQRPGSENYFPVPEPFFARFQTARDASAAAQAAAAAQAKPQTVINNTTVVVQQQRLETEASDLRGMMDLYRTILREQKEQNATVSACRGVATQASAVLNGQVREMQQTFNAKTTELASPRYSASIRPNDPDNRITARRASELFPKIPFYIPATPETGEFWLEPNVTDTGELTFNLKFIDTGSANDKVRATIALTMGEVETVRDSLCKLSEWAKVAHDNRVTNMSKRVVCFPAEKCPEENGKRDGVASTEIIFAVHEDGKTSGRIQRNRGRFADGYNMSTDNALLLQAYLNHISLEGKGEYDARTRTQEQARDLFK